jgi:hypothetical protein
MRSIASGNLESIVGRGVTLAVVGSVACPFFSFVSALPLVFLFVSCQRSDFEVAFLKLTAGGRLRVSITHVASAVAVGARIAAGMNPAGQGSFPSSSPPPCIVEGATAWPRARELQSKRPTKTRLSGRQVVTAWHGDQRWGLATPPFLLYKEPQTYIQFPFAWALATVPLCPSFALA